MKQLTAEGKEDPEFVARWQDMYNYEFPWHIEFKSVPAESPPAQPGGRSSQSRTS